VREADLREERGYEMIAKLELRLIIAFPSWSLGTRMKPAFREGGNLRKKVSCRPAGSQGAAVPPRPPGEGRVREPDLREERGYEMIAKLELRLVIAFPSRSLGTRRKRGSF
jgi:hypothetical protein